jgi:ketosteroid isomerase-like protein
MAVEQAVMQALSDTNEVFRQQIIKGGDMSAVERVYTEDATVLPPGSELVEGVEAIRTFWTHAVEALGIKDIQLTTLKAEQAGDAVVEIGRADLTLANDHVVAAKYVVHWKQDGGSWKMHTDIWNVNV